MTGDDRRCIVSPLSSRTPGGRPPLQFPRSRGRAPLSILAEIRFRREQSEGRGGEWDDHTIGSQQRDMMEAIVKLSQ